MPGNRTIPLWAANRGIRLMVRTALAQAHLDPVAVEDLSGLRRAVEERPAAVLAASEDLRLAGVDVAALVHAVGDGPAIVVLNTSRQPPNPQGTRARFLTVPFTTRDLLDSLGLGTAPAPAAPEPPWTAPTPPAPAPFPTGGPALSDTRVAEMVRAEVERQVGQIAHALVEELARRIVPEMAESLIKQELARLIADAETEAPLDGGPGSDEG